MLKAKYLVLASLMSALFVTGVEANELKVGYVNTQRIFRDAPAAQKAAKKLEGEFSRRDQDLQKMATRKRNSVSCPANFSVSSANSVKI